MTAGHAPNVYLLAFDHRASMRRWLFGVDAGEPTSREIDRVSNAKRVVFEGLRAALPEGLEAGRVGMLVDEQFGGALIEPARQLGIELVLPVERSGQRELEFEHGEAFGANILRLNPDYSKVLVRLNVEDNQELNRRQLARLKVLSDWLRNNARSLMLELLVPPTPAQLDSVHGDVEEYDRRIRPELTRRAVALIQAHGVESPLWKLEGLDDAEDARALVAQVRHNQPDAGCIVLGRGASITRVERWLEVAAPISGFVGFAIGRSIWWDAVESYMSGKLDGADAADIVATNYLHFVRTFERASLPPGRA